MRRLIEIGNYALTDVELYEGRTESVPTLLTWSGEAEVATALFLGVSNGTSNAASLGLSPLTEDRWSLECQIDITGCPDAESAILAAEAALNRFDVVLRRLNQLVDPLDEIPTANPPVSASEPAPWQVQSAVVGEATGPYHTYPRPAGSKQPTGVYDFTIDFVTSLK
jgi:hypothetical protein